MSDRIGYLFGQRTRLWIGVATLMAAGMSLSGCATVVPVRVSSYDIHVRLDLQKNQLTGSTTLAVRLKSPDTLGEGPVAVEFVLNSALAVSDVQVAGADLTSHSSRRLPSEHDFGRQLTVHRLVLRTAAEELTVRMAYAGRLLQDVAAGEKPGEIHNFGVSAHVDSEGVFLSAGGGWYPRAHHTGTESVKELADYRLEVEPVDGLELVAGATPDLEARARNGQLVWTNTYALDGLALVGGPHVVKTKVVDGTRLALHYTAAPGSADDPLDENADLFLDAAERYLRRYEPLIGPYPFENFTIVENFFSSGFAFPEFTLLSRVLLEMGPNGLKHGYLDHELLHSWWGNGIYVDPDDGNWCEALASYGANYYGFVLDGDEEGARKKRRDACNFLSRITPEKDKPLGDFGRQDGPGRGIGYSKGTMVFHMLARKIGQENFWAAMRRLTDEYVGRYASWETLKMLFEQQGGVDLDIFFEQWVRSGGAPNLKLIGAAWHSEDQGLDVTIDQGETAFALALPLRFMFDGGSSEDRIVELSESVSTVRVKLASRPTSVILDPDYHVFRKLQPAEIMPTSNTTRVGDRLLVVTAEEEISPFYEEVIRRFGGDSKKKEVIRRTMKDLSADELAGQSVLILGDAVRNEHVRQLLARTSSPVTWQESGFSVEAKAYDNPGHSVFSTVHHPDKPGGGITIYYGNSEDALGRSDLLMFYGNSLVVFDTKAKLVGDEKEYDSEVLQRMDFESQEQIAVSD